MENYIRISNLNDFIFCPKSIYYHDLYGKYEQRSYQEKSQTRGKLNHERIDQQRYSTSKDILQGLAIYSEKYQLAGKIDIYDKKEKKLIERKTKVKEIYEGYKLQLYAQYFCMQEMGYKVEKLQIYSLQDNKTYNISLPTKRDIENFEGLLESLRNFNPLDLNFTQNPNKCKKCIYRELCDYYI